MSANSFGSWFKRWGLWILLGAALLLYIVTRLFPSNGNKPKILQEAKDQAKKLKDQASKQLQEHTEKMDAKVVELDEIKKISDEEERLKRLADFANRR